MGKMRIGAPGNMFKAVASASDRLNTYSLRHRISHRLVGLLHFLPSTVQLAMIKNETESKKRRISFSTPLICLFIFLLIVHVANGLYYARALEPSPTFYLLYSLGFFLLVAWWLKEDSKSYGIKWVYDMGLFLYLGWMFILPYYLFKTRGIKAFITIFSFIGIFVGTYLIGVVVSLIAAS